MRVKPPIMEVAVPDLCAAATLDPRPGKPPGSTCREWDGHQPGWASGGPLCETELRVAERDTRLLVLDYVDLEQMIPRSLSQALDGQPAGNPGPPIPLALAPEALQAEIAHLLGVWETEVRAACNLSEPAQHGPNLPWHTTVSKRPPPAKVRAGALVQRAVTILAPRMPALARIDTAVVQPRGVEDEWQDVPGWQAVLALSDLHARARSLLGRTRRTRLLPGDCSECGAADLRQDEPRFAEDPCDVYCGACATTWTYDQYARYVELLVWPGRVAA